MQDTIEKLKNSREENRLLLLSLKLEKQNNDITAREKELQKEQEKLSDLELYKNKTVEFFSQSYAAFYSTKMEKDKTLLTLSIATLGLLTTYISPALNSSSLIAILIPSCLTLLYTTHTLISIFDLNSDYISSCLEDDEVRTLNLSTKLKKMDKRASRAFYIGVLLTITLALASQAKENAMKTNEASNEKKESSELLKKSFDGTSNLKPSIPKESLPETNEKKND